ncbi:MAG: type II toxin-antitoxin system VapC family toxin [Rhodocyclaceae bacterium]|nr:type II toxin-antitoxin system VapC family toxin [Rhodocyclaceae bacterium]
MRFLLDTHAFIWLNNEPARLSPAVQTLCMAGGHDFYLSMASAWEMQIKCQLGKLALDLPIMELVSQGCEKNGIQLLKIELAHIEMLGKLPNHHKDPFDRLLIAQAISEKLTVLSADQAFSEYPVEVVW